MNFSTHLAKIEITYSSSITFIPVWLQPCDDCYATISFTNFVDYILCFWNFYYGRFLYTVNAVEYSSPQTHVLKKTHRRSPLDPFSSLIVLVAGYFCLGLSLSPTIVWRAQSRHHTLSHGRILLRDSFFVEDFEDWQRFFVVSCSSPALSYSFLSSSFAHRNMLFLIHWKTNKGPVLIGYFSDLH